MSFLKKVEGTDARAEVYGAYDSIKFNLGCLLDGAKTPEDVHEIYMDVCAMALAMEGQRQANIDCENAEEEIGMTAYEQELLEKHGG